MPDLFPSSKPEVPSPSVSGNPSRMEPSVWFSGLALIFGILLMLFPAGLILKEGIMAFWPRKVVEIKRSSPETDSNSIHSGIVIDRTPSKSQRLSLHPQDALHPEDQDFTVLWVGSSEVFGNEYLVIHSDEMIDTHYPRNILRLARARHGPLFCYPVHLQYRTGEILRSDQPEFVGALADAIEQARIRRDRILEIELGELLSVTRKLNRAILQLNNGPKIPSEETSTLMNTSNQLSMSAIKLKAESRHLKELLSENSLRYRLSDGREAEIDTRDILHYSWPNQSTSLQRIGIWFENAWSFLSRHPGSSENTRTLFPAIFGTFVMTLLMSLAVTPIGVMAAVYLNEYAGKSLGVSLARAAVNNLAAVPSIVVGVFGLGFFVYMTGGSIDQLFFSESLPRPTFGKGGLLWASLTLALMTVPVVIVATEESLRTVDRASREAAYACGASRWQMIYKVALPSAMPGVLTGVILAMARGAGEVAPLMLVGVINFAPELPINMDFPFLHLNQKFMHLGYYIFDSGFQSSNSQTTIPFVYAASLVLLMLVFSLNLVAIYFRERLRNRFSSLN